MGKALATLNKAWEVHQQRNPNADYFSFIAGWDAAAYDFIPDDIAKDAQEPVEDTLWGFKVGDRVRYSNADAAFLGIREVIGVYPNGGLAPDGDWDKAERVELADPDRPSLGRVGAAYAASEIEKVED